MLEYVFTNDFFSWLRYEYKEIYSALSKENRVCCQVHIFMRQDFDLSNFKLKNTES